MRFFSFCSGYDNSLGEMGSLWTFVKWLFFIFIFTIVIGVFAIGGLYIYVVHDLPKLTSLADYRPPTVSQVFDNKGEKVGEFWIERRILLPYDEIPEKMIQAIISSEDDRFFEHSGIDYFGILRAMLENLRAGRVVQGGSTITQQITKSLLLSRERTYGRKIKEAFLAKEIEENFSKKEILYLYLTQTYFGNRAYGVEAAAENYFHKPLRELGVHEFALLAGLPKAPSRFSPLQNPDRALERQRYVLNRMVEEGYLKPAEALAAKVLPLTVYHAGLDKDFNNLYAPWFTEHVRRLVIEKYGEERLYKGGLKIYTTLDLRRQKTAQLALQKGTNALDKRQGYKGPPQSVDPALIKETCASLGKETQDLLETPVLLNASSSSEPLSTTLRPHTLYRAVITGLDSATKEIKVCLGDQEGLIRHSDFKWARPRDLTVPGWEDANYLSNPKERFKVGDVIEVALKETTEEDFQKNAYRRDTLYFTLGQTPEVEGGLVSYLPESGDVMAIVGGYDFKKSEFNRATQALRQPGSAFKPIVYTAALMKGYKPDTVVVDAPISFNAGNGKIWSPKNYGGKYLGQTLLRNAIAKSLNVVSVRILTDVGIDFVTAVCRLLGLTTPIERYYPMALGANDVHLLELSRAYGSFANGGILPELTFIRRLEDMKGTLLEENKTPQVNPFTSYFVSDETSQEASSINLNTAVPLYDGQSDSPVGEDEPLDPNQFYNTELYPKAESFIAAEGLHLNAYEQQLLYGKHIPPGYTLNPKVAYTMIELLKGVVEFGTAVRAKALERPAAGKTGTTNDETDAWFIGFVPQMVTGVWVGFDNHKTIGAKETGGKAALPIWLDYMKSALAGLDVAEFLIPPETMAQYYDASRIRAQVAAWHRNDPSIALPGDNSPFVGETNPQDSGSFTEEESFFSTDF